LTIQDVRNQLPHLNTDFIYLSHASSGVLTESVKKKLEEHLYFRQNKPIDNYPAVLMASSNAKNILGKFMNVEADRFAWTLNVSEGMSLLANGLKWNEGDHIILNDLEFPSNVYPFLRLADEGVKVEIIKTNGGVVEIDAIEKAITPRTKLISISHVQFISGYRTDLERLGKICKKHDIIFCVDVIQSAGTVNIDIPKMNIDFLAGGSHKWLMALTGLGYVYVSEELQEKISQKNVGWTSVQNAWDLLDYELKFKSNAERYQNGTLNSVGIIGLNASLEIFDEVGMRTIEKSVLENSEYLINSLSEMGMAPLMKNVPVENRSAIVTFPLTNPDDVLKGLEALNVSVAVREGNMRVSPHYYNNKQDLDEFIARLKTVLK
jgi:cysteine desulfurase / selenocysteine lyase